jgi:predicted nucleotidyltransferase
MLTDSTRQWTIDELATRTTEPYPTVATEVRRLQDGDLLTSHTVGRTKLLTANDQNPYFQPLAQLVLMAFGPPLVISEEFAHLKGVDSIHIYGSWASRYEGNTGPTPNDVDVLVIGTPSRDAVFDAAARSQARLGREVNVTQRTTEQWESATDGFSQQLRASPMIDVAYPSQDAEMEQGQ